MVYRKYLPSAELSAYVECYFTWQSTEPVHNLVVESPPTGFCSIVFNTGDDYFLKNKKYAQLAVPKQFIAGQAIYSYSLTFNGTINLCGIVLKPTALATIFELPTYEYTEERIPLASVVDQKKVNDLASQLSADITENEKVKLLDSFMLYYLKKQNPQPDFIDNAANTIVEMKGMLDVGKMMENVFMSRRNFERKFFKKVGLSPKYYARIRRMAYLLNIIAGKKKADWSTLFSEVEFYDQSHFIKDFIEFTGRTPQQYLEDNRELANWVEKPHPNAIVD